MAAWMVYTLLVSVLIGLGARGLEEAGRAARQPVRFLWLAALLGTLGLAGLAPIRAALPEVSAPGGAVAFWELGRITAAEVARMDAAGGLLGDLRHGVAWPVRSAAGWSGARASAFLGLAWLTLVVGQLWAGAGTILRYRRARLRWPRRELFGMDVRVSPAAGPAVLGVLRPEIVVPTWLLERSPGEQRLVVLHEREHLRAGDALTLMAGWLVAALLPWNPVVWWMLARLRLAVELDCDARVLRQDVGHGAYGSMLIDLAGREPGLFTGAPALAGSPSILERRLLAMTTSFSRVRWVRAAALGVLGALALVAACDTPTPTSAEIEAMDVASAEARAEDLELVGLGGSTTYFLDGVQVTPEEAHGLARERVAGVEIRRGEAGAVIRITSRSGPAVDADGMMIEGSDETVPLTAGDRFDGLLFIDGVLTDPSALRDLRPSEIDSIEVIKGAAARLVHDDTRAASGIIRVTTKSGGGAR